MLNHPDFGTARALLVRSVQPVQTEQVALEHSFGRVLAAPLTARKNVPAFDRSPYDGYAFRAADTAVATPAAPVSLQILEEIPAGGVPTKAVTAGTASKVLTGAPIPAGADAVVKFEDTRFSAHTVELMKPARCGDNIVRAGEDVAAGTALAACGQTIDTGIAGMLAAEGIVQPLVYRRPKVGVISTGNEVCDAATVPEPGKIRDTNRFALSAALQRSGMEPVFCGYATDRIDAIAALMETALVRCDAVVLTGGVSVGDYDCTPAAMVKIGAEMLLRGVDLKPGMACAYAMRDGKLLCGLSGNPASAMTNFYAVALPALKRLAGHLDAIPQEVALTLKNGFRKKSPTTRLLRGRLDLCNGMAEIVLPKDQGNVVLSSTIGCDVMAVVPAGSGALEAGTRLKGFLL